MFARNVSVGREVIAIGMLTALACAALSAGDDTKTPAATKDANAANVPYYPDDRVFVCRGTGLDPRQQIEFLPGHVVTLPEIHDRFVEEFTLRKGFGSERYHWRASEWVELVPGGLTPEGASDSRADDSGERTYPTQPVAGNQTKYPVRPKYDAGSERLSLAGETLRDVAQRTWKLKDMRLVGVVKHKEPKVYPGGANHSLDEKSKDQLRFTATKETPRGLDAFESAALKELRSGSELAARTTATEMRVFGAIRAGAKCTACHDIAEGSLLGAFTYTLEFASKATPRDRRLVDLADLSAVQRTSVATIESMGGVVTRDDSRPGRPVANASVRSTNFKDPGAARFAPFPTIETLDVSYTKLTDAGVERIVATNVAVKELDLSGTAITNAGLSELRKLPRLRSLALWTTSVSDEGLARLRSLTGLESLSLGQSPITDAGIKELSELRNLRVLTIFNVAKITDAALPALETLTHLEDLNLARTSITNDGLKLLRGLGQLRSLDLSLTKTTDAGLIHLRDFKQLQSLRLNRIKGFGPGVEALADLPELRTLELRVNDITSDTLKQISKLTRLESLDLGSNPAISDAALASLERLRSLRRLDLTHTQVSEAAVARLKAALPECEVRR